MIKNIDSYLEDLKYYLSIINFKEFENKKVLITGAGGLICSYIVDAFLLANKEEKLNITIYALGRNKEKLERRFSLFDNVVSNDNLIILEQDVVEPLEIKCDFIIHGASPAHPNVFASDPVGTMNANYLGMLNVLECAKENKCKVIYISSAEVYGDNRDENAEWKENDSGYVDSMLPRSSYPNSKRASETLCAAYHSQYGVNVVVARPCHVYGPTMTASDSRAVSAFIHNVIDGNDIIMKSEGKPVRSYCYVGDVFTAIITILLKGKASEAYNIADKQTLISIKELATKIAKYGNRKIKMEIPINTSGFSKIEYTKLSSEKLESLGWNTNTPIDSGIEKTLKILKNLVITRDV